MSGHPPTTGGDPPGEGTGQPPLQARRGPRTWLIAGICLAVVVIVAAVALTVAKVRSPANGEGTQAAPRPICERVDPAPLQALSLTENTEHGRVGRTRQEDDRNSEGCEIEVRGTVKPTYGRLYIATIEARSADLATEDYEVAMRASGTDDTVTEVAGLGDRAFVRIARVLVTDESGRTSVQPSHVEVFVLKGRQELEVSLSSDSSTEWNLDQVRDVLITIARQLL